MTNKNIVIALIAFALGVLFTNLYNTFEKFGYGAGRSNVSMNNMHRMPDGSMMMNEEANDMMEGMMEGMLMNMKGRSGKALEYAFIKDMIPHHQGAVDMAKLLLEDKTISKELRDFAQNIITAQESEIKMMNVWLKNY